MKNLVRLGLPVLGLLTATLVAAACSSSDDDHAHGKTASAAVVSGAADSHCGTKVVTVDTAACTADAGAESDAGADAGDIDLADYGDTMPNAEGDDDDCKYHLKWSSGAAAATTKSFSVFPRHDTTSGGTGEGGDVTFTVTITNKKDGSPVTGAPVEIEAFLDDTHPSLNVEQTSNETTPGTYTVGPVRFDVSGKWTVRFHIHDECRDSEASPHGHGAFYTQITVQ